MKIWHRGVIGDRHEGRVSLLDHGLLYGDGVFEGIRISGRRIYRLRDHLRRLSRSARAIGLALPLGEDEMAALVIATAAAHGEDEAYVRLLVTRGIGELGVDPFTCAEPELFCIVATLRMFPPEARAAGLRLVTAAQRRPRLDAVDPQVKSLNYLNNVLAKRDARRGGYDDALLLNADGRVAEATGANLFAVIDGVLVTPPPGEGALPGITRDSVLRCRRAAGGALEVRPLTRYEVLAAEEVFLSGSGAGLVGVASLDDTPIGDGRRPMLEALAAAVTAYSRAEGAPF